MLDLRSIRQDYKTIKCVYDRNEIDKKVKRACLQVFTAPQRNLLL